MSMEEVAYCGLVACGVGASYKGHFDDVVKKMFVNPSLACHSFGLELSFLNTSLAVLFRWSLLKRDATWRLNQNILST